MNETKDHKTDTITTIPTSKPFVGLEDNDILEAYTDIEFPISAYGDLINRLAQEQYNNAKRPKEITCNCALGIVAGIAGSYYKVENLLDDYIEMANLYLIGTARTGTGKTQILSKLFNSTNKELNQFSKEYEENKFYAEKNRASFDEIDPDFTFNDITAEAIALKMKRTKAALFSPLSEAGKMLDIVLGAYKRNSDELDFYNQIYDNKEDVKRERATGEVIRVESPSLSFLWLTQFDKLKSTLLTSSRAKESGFIGRVLFFNSDAKKQLRVKGEVRKICEDVLGEWNALTSSLLKHRRSGQVKVLRATEEAKYVFLDYDNKITNFINGDLMFFEDILTKSIIKVCKVALVLSIIQNNEVVDEETALNACKIVDYSNSLAIKFSAISYQTEMESIKTKMEQYFKKRNCCKLPFSDFSKRANIKDETVKIVCKLFSDDFRIEENARNGLSVLYLRNIHQ